MLRFLATGSCTLCPARLKRRVFFWGGASFKQGTKQQKARQWKLWVLWWRRKRPMPWNFDGLDNPWRVMGSVRVANATKWKVSLLHILENLDESYFFSEISENGRGEEELKLHAKITSIGFRKLAKNKK